MENLTGSSFDDLLTGSSSANRLDGGAGNDMLNGGSGNDVLEGGAGNDTLDGGSDTDTASYASAGAGVTVSLALAGAQNTVGAGNDNLISIENLTGSNFDDILTGNTGNNRLEGGSGNDTLNGGSGNDVLDGGSGNDTLIGALGSDQLLGGDGIDTANYSASASGVTVNMSTGVNSGGDAAGDTLSGIENLIGSGFTDSLTGDANANIIRSGNGSDVLRGGNGADVLVSEGSGTKQLFGDGVNGDPGVDGVDTYVVANGSSGLTIINAYTFNADPALAEDIVLPYSPTFASGSVGGQAALILQGPGHNTAILLNGMDINQAATIVSQNLTIDTDFFS
jgi:Ca2+-binding RTX toxin-like protein